MVLFTVQEEQEAPEDKRGDHGVSAGEGLV